MIKVGSSANVDFPSMACFPAPTVSIQFNARNVLNTARTYVKLQESKITFSVNKAAREDGGIYTINLTNSAGHTSVAIKVEVVG